MKVRVKADSKVLIANPDHQNFTETTELIEEGTILSGSAAKIQGKKRGADFVYRIFTTDDGRILYLNNIEPMENVEVKLGADGAQTPTTVNMVNAERFNKLKVGCAVAGAAVGFAVAKYKKKTLKQSLIFIAGGALLGYGAGYLIDSKQKVTVTPSK